MTITERNFLRLMRHSLLPDDSPVEPMSGWKWERLCQYAMMHGVAEEVYGGLKAAEGSPLLTIPADALRCLAGQAERQQELYTRARTVAAGLTDALRREQVRAVVLPGSGRMSSGDQPTVDLYFPYSSGADKADDWASRRCDRTERTDDGALQYDWRGCRVRHCRKMVTLTNPIINRRLQHTLDSQILCCDSNYAFVGDIKVERLPWTLWLLYLLVRATKYIIGDGLRLGRLVEIGDLLKSDGDKIDYVTLQSWIRELGMGAMADIVATLLSELLGFAPEELPFVASYHHADISGILRDAFTITEYHTPDWYNSQGRQMLIESSETRSTRWYLVHSAKYFVYYPKEVATNCLATWLHSLATIEE